MAEFNKEKIKFKTWYGDTVEFPKKCCQLAKAELLKEILEGRFPKGVDKRGIILSIRRDAQAELLSEIEKTIKNYTFEDEMGESKIGTDSRFKRLLEELKKKHKGEKNDRNRNSERD